MEDKIDIKDFLNDYPELKIQYVFFNCFIISSNQIFSIYKRAKANQKDIFDNIEIYFTPNYLYSKNKDNPIFDKINEQGEEEKYYFLKEHIFYYQYLLSCAKAKQESEKVNTKKINEIFYRTLINRLYLLYDDSQQNCNYGITEIFGVPCIYSIIEQNIIDQIINMKKLEFNLLQMDKDKVEQLFGCNKDIDDQSLIYNNLLSSITLSNSVITGGSNKDESFSDDGINLNNKNKGIIEMEKYLTNLSSELFLFNYITQQFEKEKLVQLPRMLFFCGIYDDKIRNIYQIKDEKKKELKQKKDNDILQIEEEKEIKKEIEKENKIDQSEIAQIKGKEKDLKQIKEETIGKEIVKKNKEVNEKQNQKKEAEKSNYIDIEKLPKDMLKCQILDFSGALEMDGAFKYKGQSIEIKGESFVIILSEYLNFENNIEKYIEKCEAIELINKINKNKQKDELLKTKKKKIFSKIDLTNEDIQKMIVELKEKAQIDIDCDPKIIINENDVLLIESKREYPKHISNEIQNFIEHSFYFIRLYDNLKLLEKTSVIHLIFVYDYHRNYNDEKITFYELKRIIEMNAEKLDQIPNKIKFNLIHSLPNLNISIFNRLENNVVELTTKVNNLTEENNKLYAKINSLTEENNTKVNSLNEENNKLSAKVKSLTEENNKLRGDMAELSNRNKELTDLVNQQANQIKILFSEINELKNKLENKQKQDNKNINIKENNTNEE